MNEPSRPFFEFWRTRAAFIEGLDHHENFHEASVLVWAALDALGNLWARCLHPDLRKPDRRRLGELLARHGGDPFRRVSLPALWARADGLDPELTGRVVRARLRNFGARKEPTVLEQRQARMPTDDPFIEEVLLTLNDIVTEMLPKGGTVRDLVLRCRFGEIAYTEMRCAILHEGRLGDGAHGFELGPESHDGPTYLSSVFGVPPAIGFSPQYMVKVLRECINGFEVQAKGAGVDPVPPLRGCTMLDPDEEAEP